MRNPEDAFLIGERARELSFTSTVRILQRPLRAIETARARHQRVYERFSPPEDVRYFVRAFDSFQENISRGLPNDWHCSRGRTVPCTSAKTDSCTIVRSRGDVRFPLEDTDLKILSRGRTGRKAALRLYDLVRPPKLRCSTIFENGPREHSRVILERRRKNRPGFRLRRWSDVVVALLGRRRRSWFAKLTLNVLASGEDGAPQAPP